MYSGVPTIWPVAVSVVEPSAATLAGSARVETQWRVATFAPGARPAPVAGRDLRAGRERDLGDVALLGAADRLAGGVHPCELELGAPGQIDDGPGVGGGRDRGDVGAPRGEPDDLQAVAEGTADVDRGRRALALPGDLALGRRGEALGRDGLARLAIDDDAQAR